jgi:hypothetical protein
MSESAFPQFRLQPLQHCNAAMLSGTNLFASTASCFLFAASPLRSFEYLGADIKRTTWWWWCVCMPTLLLSPHAPCVAVRVVALLPAPMLVLVVVLLVLLEVLVVVLLVLLVVVLLVLVVVLLVLLVLLVLVI